MARQAEHDAARGGPGTQQVLRLSPPLTIRTSVTQTLRQPAKRISKVERLGAGTGSQLLRSNVQRPMDPAGRSPGGSS